MKILGIKIHIKKFKKGYITSRLKANYLTSLTWVRGHPTSESGPKGTPPCDLCKPSHGFGSWD